MVPRQAARTIKSTDPTQVGQLLPNTAHNQANVWTTYEFEEGWEVVARDLGLLRRDSLCVFRRPAAGR